MFAYTVKNSRSVGVNVRAQLKRGGDAVRRAGKLAVFIRDVKVIRPVFAVQFAVRSVVRYADARGFQRIISVKA